MLVKCRFCHFEFDTNQRSVPQNKMYWNILNSLSNHWGHSKDELHEKFKKEFLREDMDVLGDKFYRVKSTTDLDTLTFGRYLRDIAFFAAEFDGTIVPVE